MPTKTDVIPLPPREFIECVGGGDYAGIGQHLFDLICEHCAATPSANILDIGSGCGRVAIPFTKYLATGSYEGIDVVPGMVEWCQNNISTRFPAFHFQHADVKNTLYRNQGVDASTYVFPFSDNKFDVVFATSVFTHLLPPSAIQYAREIARVLKPEGRAFLTFFILDDETRRKKAAGAKIIPFAYQREGYALEDENKPEAVIAYEAAHAIDILESGGLAVRALSRGSWSENTGWTYQDAFIVTKKRGVNIENAGY